MSRVSKKFCDACLFFCDNFITLLYFLNLQFNTLGKLSYFRIFGCQLGHLCSNLVFQGIDPGDLLCQLALQIPYDIALSFSDRLNVF